MSETLLSVGIDLGTTTTQMILSRLQLENRASDFSVPQMEITGREILYRNPICFTPLLSDDTLDAHGIREIVADAYKRANIRPEDIQTGAVIITGETARKENAKAVLDALSAFAGEFVVATAGPALEGVLAARGAGADRLARERHTHVLHMDIGGGTSNLALFDPDGQLIDTSCFNVGGRLLKFSKDGTVHYCSPVLSGVSQLRAGDWVQPSELKPLLELLVRVLEEAAGFCPFDQAREFVTDHLMELPAGPVLLSFSGGVGELIRNHEKDWLKYGDMGVLLADAIRESKLCSGAYAIGQETVQATVVGAGSYSTELTGSTVEYSGITFPIQDLPVVTVPERVEQVGGTAMAEVLSQRCRMVSGGPAALALRGIRDPSFDQLKRLAAGIVSGLKDMPEPIVVVMKEDMAKALGQMLRSLMKPGTSIVCLDGLSLKDGSYLDIGSPVGDGSALPVVIKTLAFM